MTDRLTDLLKKDYMIFELDVKDLERAKKFYTETLGLEILWDGGEEVGWCQLSLPLEGLSLGLNLKREGEVTQGSGKIYFDSIDDLEPVEKFLKEKGVKTEPINDIPDMVSILTAYDTEGNEIGFTSGPRIKTK